MTINESETEPENDVTGKSLTESDFGTAFFYSTSANWNTADGTIWDFSTI